MQRREKESVVYVCVCERACVLGGDGSRLFARIALVVEYMAVYLPSCIDCVASFREPLLPHYRCNTSVKNV